MTQEQLAAALRAEQDGGGAFACRVTHRDGREELDHNAFATALVLRELARLPAYRGMDGVRRRALDFVERCADARIPGAYGFWPTAERPPWGRSVPADCDDTAVVSLELMRAGRRTAQSTRDTVYDVLVAALRTDVPACGPVWVRGLTFPTWLGPDFRERANPIDCAVNANVLALMARCGLAHLPGYAEAIAMIGAAVAWVQRGPAAERPLRLASMTPYYPDARVVGIILAHAVACGVDGLRPAAQRLRMLLRSSMYGDHVLCGNAYGGPAWRCAAFELVRGAAERYSRSTVRLSALSSSVTR